MRHDAHTRDRAQELEHTCTRAPGITQVTDGRSSTGFTVVPWAERASGPSHQRPSERAWATHHHMHTHTHTHSFRRARVQRTVAWAAATGRGWVDLEARLHNEVQVCDEAQPRRMLCRVDAEDEEDPGVENVAQPQLRSKLDPVVLNDKAAAPARHEQGQAVAHTLRAREG
jgi:hypothetical protein